MAENKKQPLKAFCKAFFKTLFKRASTKDREQSSQSLETYGRVRLGIEKKESDDDETGNPGPRARG